MMRPNWFDERYEERLKSCGADEALKVVIDDLKIREAVKEALELYDRLNKDGGHGYGGPSRTQAIRTAIAETLREGYDTK